MKFKITDKNWKIVNSAKFTIEDWEIKKLIVDKEPDEIDFSKNKLDLYKELDADQFNIEMFDEKPNEEKVEEKKEEQKIEENKEEKVEEKPEEKKEEVKEEPKEELKSE